MSEKSLLRTSNASVRLTVKLRADRAAGNVSNLQTGTGSPPDVVLPIQGFEFPPIREARTFPARGDGRAGGAALLPSTAFPGLRS